MRRMIRRALEPSSPFMAACLAVAWTVVLATVSVRVAWAETAASDSAAAGASTDASKSSASSAKHTPELHLLEDRLTLREPFNAARGAVRVVAFLAPSCPRCLKNAGELYREVFAKNPDADIAAFIVWMAVLKNDDEEAAKTAIFRLPDARVHHYWDPDRQLIHQLRDAVMFDVNLRLYDVFLLYDQDAVWEKRVPRPGYWMHEYKGMTGPWWDVKTFAREVARGLRGDVFSNPMD